LETLLVKRGLDWERSSHIAHHVFPPDGISLAELANQIAEMYLGPAMNVQGNDEMIEEISSPSLVSKEEKRSMTEMQEDFKLPDNFFEMLSQKHSVLSESNLVEVELSSESESDEMNVEGRKEAVSFANDFYYFNNSRNNDNSSGNTFLDGNEENIEGIEVLDIPASALDELQLELLLENRRKFLNSNLLEYNLDISSLREHSMYNHILEQYLAGKGIFVICLFVSIFIIIIDYFALFSLYLLIFRDTSHL
jgi:hypothetical protein